MSIDQPRKMVNESDSIDLVSLVAWWCFIHHTMKERNKRKIFTNLLLLLELLTADSAGLLLALALLEEGLGDKDLVLGGNGTVKVSSVCPQR